MNKSIKIGMSILFLLMLSSFAFADFGTNNVAWYSGVSGTTYIDSADIRNATLTGSPTVVNDVNGTFIVYNGANQYAKTSAYTTGGENQKTISLWVNASSWADGQKLIERNQASGVVWTIETTGGTLQFRMDDIATQYVSIAQTNLDTNKWYNLVMTYHSSHNLTAYINGVYINKDTTVGGSLEASTSSLWIGSGGDNTDTTPTNLFNGAISDVAIWNRSLSFTEITNLNTEGRGYDFYNPTSLNVTITAKDNATLSNINIFNATVNGTFYDTVTGTITLPYLKANSEKLNITVRSENYVNYFNENYDASNSLFAYMNKVTYPININGFESVSGNVFTNFTINSTLYNTLTTNGTISISLPLGSNLLNVSNDLGYYNFTNYDFNVTGAKIFNINFSNVKLNVTGYDLVGDSKISNFTINLTSLSYGDSFVISTTNGTVFISDLITGDYNLTIDAPGFAITRYNTTLTQGLNTYNATVYTTNSVRFEIYDEVSDLIIDYTNVTLDIVGVSSSSYTTTNGTKYVDLLTPSNYEIRYYSTNIDDYKLRSSFITVNNRSSQLIKLYLLNESDPAITTATRTFNVFNQNLEGVEGATVIVSRYYSDCNCYLDVWSRKTDSNAQAIGQFETIDAFYRYRVEYDGENKFNSDISGTQWSVSGTTDIFISTAPSNYEDYVTLNEVDYNPITFTNTSNQTGYFQFTYSYSSAIGVCLEVQESSYSGLVINNTCVESSGATIFFNVNASGSTKTYLAKAKIKVTEDLGFQVVDSKSVVLGRIETPTGTIWIYNMTWLAILITMASVLIYIKKSPRVALVFQATTFLILTALPIRFVNIGITAGVVAFCTVLFIIHQMRN